MSEARQRILVVEDNPVNHLMIRSFLERRGFEVQVVENGAEAVSFLEAHCAALVLMDIHMPVMEGDVAARLIRGMDGTGKTIPIIALTSEANESMRARVTNAGMNELITKPFQPDVLINVIHRHLALPPDDSYAGKRFEKLRDYTAGDLAHEAELKLLFVQNLEELEKEVAQLTRQSNTNGFRACLHKCKTTLQFIDDPYLNQLLEQIQTAIHVSSYQQLPADLHQLFSATCDDLIRDLQRVEN